MEVIGLRELRQRASELVRRVEGGEQITVAGRPSARLVPAERLRRLSVLQRQFDALPVDEAVAASYGQLTARLCTRNPKDLRGADERVDVVAV